MQGLILPARGADGPTQQYTYMHVCAFMFHASLSVNLFIYLFTMEADVEGNIFNLIIYRDANQQKTNILRRGLTPLHTHTHKDGGAEMSKTH